MLDLLRQPGSVLLCGSGWGPQPTLLSDPVRVISGTAPEALPAALDEAERELAAGRTVAGFICYEAGRAYGLQTHDPWAMTPLFWFGVYEAAAHPPAFGRTPPHGGGDGQTATTRDLPDSPRASDAVHPSPAGRGRPEGPEVGFRLNITRDQYTAAIARIKELIASGDTYQVNYTCHARFAAALDPLDYFLAMVGSHPVPYAAYVNTGEAQILSVSPELLLEKRGDILRTKPMKGTRKRGRTAGEDEALRVELLTSLKDRAENLMIVDMMRNDLGRICEVGSVETPILFEAEKYDTVWQMTTTVTGRLPRGPGLPGPASGRSRMSRPTLAQIMAATLPGSSVTGAPKRRTMEIIHELEPEPRGVYCGAVGVFHGAGDFTLNLPIRTLVHRDGAYDLGIGAGIVWDSDPDSEYEETILKSQFARRRLERLAPELRLFETMLVDPRADIAPRCPDRIAFRRRASARCGHVAYLSEHLARLAGSAAYWGFTFDADAARAEIRQFAAGMGEGGIIRLELGRDGSLHLTSRPLPEPPAAPVRIVIAPERTDSGDRLLYHKTNQRALYDSARAALPEGVFEVLFRNEAGNLTEGTISNLFVQHGGRWLTPPLMDGLLPGVWRADFMARSAAVEEHLTPEMLADAEEITIGNSVRGAIVVDEVVMDGRVLWRRQGGE